MGLLGHLMNGAVAGQLNAYVFIFEYVCIHLPQALSVISLPNCYS